MEILIVILSIIAIDAFLGIDNAIIIGSAVKNITNPRKKNIALLVGVSLALLFRFILIMFFLWISTVDLANGKGIPFIEIVGGIILIQLSFNLTSSKKHNKENDFSTKDKMFLVIFTILVADAVTSIDNAIAMVGILETPNLTFFWMLMITILSLIFIFPIIFFGAKFVNVIVSRYFLLNYIVMFLLLFIGFELIIGDPLWWEWISTTSISGWYIIGSSLFMALVFTILKVTLEIKHKPKKREQELLSFIEGE